MNLPLEKQEKLKAAFDEVAIYYPSVSSVYFDEDGGWEFSNELDEAFIFPMTLKFYVINAARDCVEFPSYYRRDQICKAFEINTPSTDPTVNEQETLQKVKAAFDEVAKHFPSVSIAHLDKKNWHWEFTNEHDEAFMYPGTLKREVIHEALNAVDKPSFFHRAQVNQALTIPTASKNAIKNRQMNASLEW